MDALDRLLGVVGGADLLAGSWVTEENFGANQHD
jgi:hypothetical protein